MDSTIKSVAWLFIFFCVFVNAKAQNTYRIVIKSANGQSNVVGASVYKPYFSEDRTTDEFYFKTSLPVSNNAENLTKNVLGPLIGTPSDGDKVYLKLLIKDGKRLDLLKNERQSFSTSTKDSNYFYLLVHAETIKEAEDKLIYETFQDLAGSD